MKGECRQVREALLDLPEPARDPGPSVAGHLQTCVDCRSFWEGWRAAGDVLRALDQPEPVDPGRVALAMVLADAPRVTRSEGRPLFHDLFPALLLGSLILGLHAGAWVLWGAAGLAGVQAVSGLLLPLAILGAARLDLAPTGGRDL